MDAERVQRDVETIRTQGWVVVEDLIPAADLPVMRAALAPHLDAMLLGRNNFEGHATQRVYSLVAKHPVFAALAEHPYVLGLCDAFLAPNYLLTASQAICIRPGETAQPWHTDDSFYPIPRPRPAISLSTIVAIDAFTTENGATQLIPGSHRWDDAAVDAMNRLIPSETVPHADRRPAPPTEVAGLEDQAVDLVMPAGAAIVFLGTLVHRGGANRSDASRLALSNQYCEPWARPQENYFLSIPRAEASAMSARLQALLGYSVHPPFMGHQNGLHPRRVLEA
jgi:ectoine hydroxylase-related dioxygenase (phytanoyl-CoA dioxygenase family)